jgi:outer membrane protein assembly factor BamB
MRRACFVSALVLLATSTISLRADNWPQWRGVHHNGVSEETSLPQAWDKDKSVAWKLKMPGIGSSTPAVWGGKIFLTSQADKDIVLLCASTDGKEMWRKPLGKAGGKVRGDEGNSASSSPCTDGKHVWAMAGDGVLFCFDLLGKEIWRVDLQKKYGKFNIQFGMHSTPVLHGDRLYLQLIHSGGAWVIALNKKDGEQVWKVERKSDGRAECEHSYASPTLWTKGDKALLITHGNDYAIGHELKDGKEVWRVGGLNPKSDYNNTLRFVSSPAAAPDLIVVPSAKNGPVVGLKPSAAGLVMPDSQHVQWHQAKGTPDVPSPLIHNGLVYLCEENGFLQCVDAKTGKRLYRERLKAERYRASPVFGDGKIYLTARDATVTVVKAGRKFERLAVNKLSGETMTASPALANGRIYLRTWDNLYAIGPNVKKEK